MSYKRLVVILLYLLSIGDHITCYRRNRNRNHHILKRDASTPSTTLPDFLRGNDLASTTAPTFPTLKSTTRPDFQSTTKPVFIPTTRWNGKTKSTSEKTTTSSSNQVYSIKVTVPRSSSKVPVDMFAGPGFNPERSTASHIYGTQWLILLVLSLWKIMSLGV